MKKRILFPMVIAGFAIGLGAASQIWPKQSRAERIAELFYGICLAPVLTGLSPDTQLSGLARTHDILGGRAWIDPQSMSLVEHEQRRCEISTFAPHPLLYQDAEALLPLIEEIVSVDFPQLVYDPQAKMGYETLTKGWFKGRPSSPERWGIFHVVHPDWGDGAGSFLTFRAPITQE